MKLLNFALFAGLTAAAVAAAPARAAAQGQPKDSSKKSTTIPADARPPKGMCRIWLDNVPAAQQPAATDCPTAVKNRPQNGHVIFGDDLVDSSKTKTEPKLPPGAKGFTGVKTVPITLPKRPPED